MILSATEFFARSPAELPHDVEDAFFSAIRNRNRTFKRTYRRRFAQLDRELVEEMRRRLPGGPVELLDVGISSGATTLDLQEALSTIGLRPRVTGTDLAIDGFIVPLGRGCSALSSSDGHALQFTIGKQVLRPWPRRLDWLTGMWAVRPLLVRWLERRLRSAWKKGSSTRPVQLVSPRLLQQPGIHVVEDNVLSRRDDFVGRYDLIRAANILNRNYFAAEDLQRAVRNLTAYLAGPGSCLLIVRSLRTGDHHGTLFVLDAQRRLQVLKRFGDGSEIEELALTA